MESQLASLPGALSLQIPVPVVVVIGGAGGLDPPLDGAAELPPRVQRYRDLIESTFADALRPVVRDRKAVVLTGGTAAGVMKMAGELLAHEAAAVIGVVPASKVQGDKSKAVLDDNHSAAVLTGGSRWGSETEFLFHLAETLTGGTAPGVVVLANGGPVSFEEARRFLRGGWPIMAVGESGEAADDLIKAARADRHDSQWGDLHQADVETLGQDAAVVRRQFAWRLHDDELLKSAWGTFGAYDRKAKQLKRSAQRSRWMLTGLSSILLVAITATVQFTTLGWLNPDGSVRPGAGPAWLDMVLPAALTVSKWVVLALPLGIAVAAALGNFSGSQAKWRTVRASAETLKREIYRYRSHRAANDPEAAGRLSAVLHVVDDEAIRADVGLAESPPGLIRGRPANVDLDELEPLSPRIYQKRRLEQQLLWFVKAARKRRRGEWFIAVAGAVAASVAMALVTTRFAAWVAVLVLASTVFAFSRERGLNKLQMAGYDRAIAEVNDAWIQWIQETPEERGRTELLVDLVGKVETAFERESLSWSEVMRKAAQTATEGHATGLGA